MTEAIRAATNETIIELKDVNKWYGEFQALADINLSVKRANVSWSAARRALGSLP